ncbi:uncharacterized protein J3R85_020561 [Psidium guajava]|nr:uncharacterized protein J3R85_020561 [Psidium guajava]
MEYELRNMNALRSLRRIHRKQAKRHEEGNDSRNSRSRQPIIRSIETALSNLLPLESRPSRTPRIPTCCAGTSSILVPQNLAASLIEAGSFAPMKLREDHTPGSLGNKEPVTMSPMRRRATAYACMHMDATASA